MTKCRLLLFVMLFSITQLVYAAPIDKIVVFGDSLSDNGNIYALTKRIPFVPLIPKNPPYYEGRFSNGPIWVDDLATAMNVPLEDYAYAGAWAEPLIKSGVPIPSLGMQVTDYLMRSILDRSRASHLFVIWTGGNDYLHGRTDPVAAAKATVDTIKGQIEWLTYYNAKNILILNLPDLSTTPEVVALGADVMAQVAELTRLHNEFLAAMLQDEMKKFPDVKFVSVDTVGYFKDIMTHPQKYHLKNTTEACYNEGYWLHGVALENDKGLAAAKEAGLDIMSSPSLKAAYLTGKMSDLHMPACANPDEYLFWDHVHPTRVMHALIASETLKALQENNMVS